MAQTKEPQEPICLNNQTVGNLKKYLSRFPDDASVVIHAKLNSGEWANCDCCIACNFEYQQKENIAILYCGLIV